jgi:hypothetical protein
MVDYYAGCIKDMYNSMENKVYSMKIIMELWEQSIKS